MTIKQSKVVILLLLIAVVIPACNEKEFFSSAGGDNNFLFKAEIDGDTKVSVSQGVSSWQNNDQIGVFGIKSEENYFRSINKPYVCTLQGDDAFFSVLPPNRGVDAETDHFYAIYPYTNNYPYALKSYSVGRIDVHGDGSDIVAGESYTDIRYSPFVVEGNQYLYTDATSSRLTGESSQKMILAGEGHKNIDGAITTLHFTPMCSILELGLKGNVAISKVKVELVDKASVSNCISGKGLINLENKAVSITNINTSPSFVNIYFRKSGTTRNNYLQLSTDEISRIKIYTTDFNASMGLKITFTRYSDGKEYVKYIWNNNSAENKCSYIDNDGVRTRRHIYQPISELSDALWNAVSTHPTLLIEKSDIAAIKSALSTSSQLKTISDYVMSLAETALTEPVNERVLTGKRLLNVSVSNLTRIFSLSYAYQLTENTKYSYRAIEEMMKASSFVDWNPSHFLDVAEMTMALAIGYDWCYDQLAPSQRSIIERAIKEKGLIPSQNEEYNVNFLRATNNWGQVCHSALAYGAAAIKDVEPDLAQAIISRSITNIEYSMAAGYGENGAYPEGPGYWCYGTSYNVLFLHLIERLYGTDYGLKARYPNFMATVKYYNSIITPSFNVFTYSDQAFPPQINIVPYYMFGISGDNSYLYSMNRLLAKDVLSLEYCRHQRLLPASIIFGVQQASSLGVISQPSELYYIGGGANPIALFRSNWGDNSLYLGFKAGTPNYSHGHMDVGSFYLENEGVRWSMDMGGEVYNNIEKENISLSMEQTSARWSLMRYSPQGHSVLTFDDERQLVSGNAQLTQTSTSNPDLMYAESDLSSLYSNKVSSVTRRVTMKDRRYVIVEDNITTSSSEVLMRWNMVTDATSWIYDTDNKKATLTCSGKQLYVSVTSPTDIIFQTISAQPSTSYEQPNTQYRFGYEATLAPNTSYRFITTLSNETSIGDIDPHIDPFDYDSYDEE